MPSVLGTERDLLARYDLPANGWGVLMFHSTHLTDKWQSVHSRFENGLDPHRMALSWWKSNMTLSDKGHFVEAARDFAVRTGNTDLLDRTEALEPALRFEMMDAALDIVDASSSPKAFFRAIVEFCKS